VNEFDEEYYRKQIEMALYIEALYYEIFVSIIEISRIRHLPKDKIFLFKDYPKISKTANDIIDQYSSKLIGKIKDNMQWAWGQANKRPYAL
jgi:hypothetical protein